MGTSVSPCLGFGVGGEGEEVGRGVLRRLVEEPAEQEEQRGPEVHAERAAGATAFRREAFRREKGGGEDVRCV